METYLFLWGLVVLSVVEAALGFISIGVIKWCNYLTRSKINPKKYWYFKRRMFGYEYSSYQSISTCVAAMLLLVWVIVCLLINSLVHGVQVAETLPFEALVEITNYLAIPLAVLFISPLLRWVIDVSRNLRIKKDNGASEEIAELKARLEQLENK